MNNLFGGLFGSNPNPMLSSYFQAQQERALEQAYWRGQLPLCIHSDCPICKEEQLQREKKAQELAKQKEQAELNKKQRNHEYMMKFKVYRERIGVRG